MDYLKIRNWDQWQSYRSDRSQPPWIKLHRCLMRNQDWVALTDAQRGQLVSIWLLAADRKGEIPKDPKVIQKLCYMDSEPDIDLFVKHGFIELDANVTPERRQDDANVTKQTRLDKTRLDKKEPIVGLKPNGTQVVPTSEIISIIDFLNEKTGKAFNAKNPAGALTATGMAVKNLLKAGYTVEQIRMVVARKSRDWSSNPDMVGYLRPKTLFAKSNFENYIGECVL